jgi:flavin reductase (DIM6/NTAB) family NADH-FMN oxidoreductase RutF
MQSAVKIGMSPQIGKSHWRTARPMTISFSMTASISPMRCRYFVTIPTSSTTDTVQRTKTFIWKLLGRDSYHHLQLRQTLDVSRQLGAVSAVLKKIHSSKLSEN